MQFVQVVTLSSSLVSKLMGSRVMTRAWPKPQSTRLSGSLGLTLSSTVALSQATASVGSLLRTLKASSMAALTLSRAGDKSGLDGREKEKDRFCSPRKQAPTDQSADRLRKQSRLYVIIGFSGFLVKTVAAVIGGVVYVASVPTVLGAVGFTGAGITASSLAAKMMSSAAIANGGGIAAGSLVATLQSVGAAGLSLSTKIILGSLGSVLTFLSF
uniref:Interferon alpha inducible protein 27 n=1 Tax=Mustela putorius furo TaxID=9669 RepID=M3XVZ3_MUSPF